MTAGQQRSWWVAAALILAIVVLALCDSPSLPLSTVRGDSAITPAGGANPIKSTNRSGGPAARSAAALAAEIDAALNVRIRQANLTVSARADDAEFARRVTLDLIGRIPTVAEASAYIDNPAPSAVKRAALVEKLLASPEFGRHLSDIWHKLMVPRDSNIRNLDTASLRAWLADSFNSNRGWDRTVAEILTAEGSHTENPQIYFWLANGENGRPSPSKATAAASQLFMGVQLQCAECHNHPFTKWKQTDFWSMAAFFSQVKIQGNPKSAKEQGQPLSLSESPKAAAGRNDKKPQGKAAAVAAAPASPAVIAIPESGGKVVAARLPESDTNAPLKAGEPFRPALADWMTAPDNPYVARAMVNRLWAHFFGRGLVHPVDDFHPGNPPSHPAILKLLTAEFTTSGFDVKHIVRSLTATEAYGRTSRPAATARAEVLASGEDLTLLARMPVKVMTAEVLFESLRTALGDDRPDAPAKMAGQPKAQGPRAAFVGFFDVAEDGTPTDEYVHGIPQVLRLMNDTRFNRPSRLAGELRGLPLPAAIERMFLATLSRRPTSAEVTRFTAFLKPTAQADNATPLAADGPSAKPLKGRDRNKDRKQNSPLKNTDSAGSPDYPAAIWILINSAEFVVNH